MQVAKTIQKQLGGKRFSVMTGAKNYVGGKDYLSFKFPRSKGVNYLKITLNGMDLYDLEFGYIHGMKYAVKKSVTGVYAEDLQKIFTEVTGLYTSL